jgi:hypothetical protein
MIDRVPHSDLPPGMHEGDEDPRDNDEQLEIEKGEEKADFERNDC